MNGKKNYKVIFLLFLSSLKELNLYIPLSTNNILILSKRQLHDLDISNEKRRVHSMLDKPCRQEVSTEFGSTSYAKLKVS